MMKRKLELAEFIRNCAKVGYARTRLQVLAVVQSMVNKKGLDVRVTNQEAPSRPKAKDC